MKKRILAFTLLTSMLCSMFAMPVSAYTDAQLEAADLLNENGLFNGYGDDENGNPVYGLDDTLTRTEGIVLLIRLLGKEDEVLAGTYSHPFTDVETWAEKYVGYAYENGLTSGVSATLFGSAENMTTTQYITFALRALGYETGSDFTYENAIAYAVSLGVIEASAYTDTQKFTRGNVVEINVDTLNSKTKNGDTLANKLGVKISSVDVSTDVVIPTEKAGTTTVGLNDYSSSLWKTTNETDSGYAINLNYLGEGIILDYNALDVLSSVDSSEVAQTLTDILYEINPNVYLSSGYKVVSGNTILVQIQDEDEGLVVGLSGFMTGSANRSMWMNTLGYRTGDWDMAQAVYGVYYDYYNYVNEGTMPTEILDKYGLTLVSRRSLSDFAEWLTVTNGTSTWELTINMNPNMTVYNCNVTIIK